MSKTTKYMGLSEAFAHGIVICFLFIYIYLFFKKTNTQIISYLVESTSNLITFLTHNLSFDKNNITLPSNFFFIINTRIKTSLFIFYPVSRALKLIII